MNLQLDDYRFLVLLLALPIAGILAWNNLRWRKDKQKKFADLRFQEFFFGKDNNKKSTFWIIPIFLLGMASLIVAISDIIGDTQPTTMKQKTGNILFAVDVSNSMNAEDIPNNRLEMSKNILINTLPTLGTDRVGIIVFAGDAKSIMPLTTDYSSAETYIHAIETSMIKNQGTDFLRALEEASTKFKNIAKGNRQIVFLSDGEDNENNTEAAINLAKKEGITIHTIGIGTDEGAPIPIYAYGQLMGYKLNRAGDVVLSQRATKSLQQMAQETGGVYIEGNSLEDSAQKLGQALKNNFDKTSEIIVKSNDVKHYYQYPLALSLICFFVIYLFNPRKDLKI